MPSEKHPTASTLNLVSEPGENIMGQDSDDPVAALVERINAQGDAASNGNGDSESPDAKSSEEEISGITEESVARLQDKRLRAMGEEILALRREMRLRSRNTDHEEDDVAVIESDQGDEIDWEQAIPEQEGYEAITPVLRGVTKSLYQEIRALKAELGTMRQAQTLQRADTVLDTFTSRHPDYKGVEQDMVALAEELGHMPTNLKGLERLYQVASQNKKFQRLEADRKAGEKAGPSPRVGGGRTSVREQMERNPNKKLTLEESLRLGAMQMARNSGIR